MKSIRLFLTISIISTVVLANFVAAIHGYQESMKEAEELFDQKLVSFARLLSKTTQFMPLPNDASKQTSNDKKTSDNEIQYQVRDKNGKLLLHSSQLGEPFNFELQEGPGYLNFQHSRWRFLTFYSDKDELEESSTIQIIKGYLSNEKLVNLIQKATVVVCPYLSWNKI